MKNLCIYILFLFVLSACSKNNCNQIGHTEVFAPAGYTISKIEEKTYFHDINRFQFINNEVGYVSSRRTFGALHRSVDGGPTYEQIRYPLSIAESLIDMAFQDENIGVLSIKNSSGCLTHNCDLPPKLLLTRDGGLNWEEIIIGNIPGRITQCHFDNEILYVLIHSEGSNFIAISVDYGTSWQTIFEAETISPGELIRRITVLEDKLHILTDSEKIVITDSAYEIEKVIALEEDVFDVQFLDDENFIVSYFDQISKSSDGGNSWETIHHGVARLGHFISSKIGFIIVEKSSCEANYRTDNGAVIHKMDVIAITTDGGSTWTESEVATVNLGSDYQQSQKLNSEEWILAVGDNIFRLEKN